MKEEQDEFCQQPEDIQDIIPIKEQHELPPPKPPLETQKQPHLKMIDVQREKEFYLYRPFKLQKHQSSEEEDEEEQIVRCKVPFRQFYSKEQCVYMRHDNSGFNQLKGQVYYSGQFINRNIITDIDCSIKCCIQGQTCQISDILRQYYDTGPMNLFGPSQTDLIFDSHFESGNLFAAFKVSEFQYDLVMQNDTNSIGSNQWFYFAVEGLKQNKQYTFSVINYTKSDSLFNYGMKPVVYSLIYNNRLINLEKGWKHMGSEVSYRKGKLPRQNSSRMYYRLSFKISTAYQKDKLWIAHSYPYKYETLQKFIHQKKQKMKDFVTVIQIGKTLSKRSIQALILAYPLNKKRDNRKAVVVMARQHPGETQGSFVCEGVIDRLLSKQKQADFLLKNFVFYVIPMVNIDGVVFGHYRTNLAGKDLNRKWNSTEKDFNCPEIAAIKSYLNQIHKSRQIRFILDLHGHSRKLNSFFYGNPYPDSPEAVRIFPYTCSKLHPGVQFFECTFATQEYKRAAARVYLSFAFKLVHVYTFESSFYAYQKEGKLIEFTQREYRQLGATLASGLYLQLQHQIKYQEGLEFNMKKNITKEYLSSNFVKYLMELKNNQILLEQGSKEQSGSDSKPEEGEVENEELQYNKVQKGPQIRNKELKSQSFKLPRKTVSELKDPPFTRPTKNLRYLEISKINSFLPDKQAFCLQPIKKKEKDPHPAIMNSLKAQAESQTEEITQQVSQKQFSESQLHNANLSHSFIPDTLTQRKATSYIRSMHNRNNIIFRLEYMTNTTQHQLAQNKKKKGIKNALSQTMLTFGKEREKTEPLNQQWVEKQTDSWLRAGKMKLETPFTSMMLKKDNPSFYFNGLVQKYLTKKEPARSFDLPITRLDKSFSIKKKEPLRR